MNALQQIVIREIEVRGGKVFTFDNEASMLPLMIEHARRQLERMRRYGARKIKVAVRRNKALLPTAAIAEVSALRRDR